MATTTSADERREEIRRHYAAAAAGRSCAAAPARCAPGYDPAELAELPEGVDVASFGSGNPIAIAGLREGEVVLDLGSGPGLDALLAARRVGPSGTVYGLDMTDEMLALARRNARAAGATNVHLLKGVIERIPLPAESVDVVVSNCVINLSPDKPAVLAEIARVLRPGGRVSIADVVAEDGLAPEERAEHGSWASCAAGALSRSEYEAGLAAAGLERVSVRFANEGSGIRRALVEAVKPVAGTATASPVSQPAARESCC